VWILGFLLGGFLLSALLTAFLTLNATQPLREIGSERLYWEYAGRMLGETATPGYPEWVQQRVGDVPGVSTAAADVETSAPYTNFVAEYPPAALLYFAALRSVLSDYADFARAHNILMALAFLGGVGFALLLLRQRLESMTAPRALIAATMAGVAAPAMVYMIGGFIVLRFDALTMGLAGAALYLAARKRPGLAGLLLGIAGAVKLWAVFLLPFLPGNRRAYLTAGSAATLAFVACHGALMAFGTAPGDLLGYLTYITDRPIHSESLLAMGRYLAEGPTDLVFSFGSWNLPDSPGAVLPGLLQYGFIAAMGAVALWRLSWPDTADSSALGAAALGAIALLLVASKVFSGEYMIWLVPLALAAAGYSWGAGLILAGVAMAGVKLGYIVSAGGEQVGQAEILVFIIKWTALAVLSGLAVRAMVKARFAAASDM